jgi:hypothetical protein
MPAFINNCAQADNTTLHASSMIARRGVSVALMTATAG